MTTTSTATAAKNGFRPIDKIAVSLAHGFMGKGGQLEHIQLVDSVSAGICGVNAKDERGKVRTVVVSLPAYLDWGTPINQAEAANMDNRPNRSKAVIEHFGFIMALVSHGIEVQLLPPKENIPEGVYTRDIGFVAGKKLIHCNMGADVRKPEQEQLIGGIIPPREVMIEGGNVVLEGDLLFLGTGDRTNLAAVKWLQEVVGTEFEVINVPLKPGILHLDCAFGPIAKPNGHPGGALVYESAFADPASVTLLKKVYGKLHGISQTEAKLLGTNGFWINPETVFVNPRCEKVIEILNNLGTEVIHLPMDEVVLGEGYARCSTLPLVRE
ncbi:hypothetical protein HY990_00960 [Candidatus Micrarchaeota archaeon]|nr:hypothetical protein [Candidatus Micrarchaeota archaeon]